MGSSTTTKKTRLRAAQSYQDDGFQIQIDEEGGKFLVYSRRTAKEVVVATQ